MWVVEFCMPRNCCLAWCRHWDWLGGVHAGSGGISEWYMGLWRVERRHGPFGVSQEYLSRVMCCVLTRTHTHTCAHAHTRVHTHTHVHAYTHMYTHKWHRHVHTHVHAWAHMRTHTYTNVYRYSQQFMVQGNTCILTRYPAGFVYIFSIFYTLTGQGHQLRVAQYMFAVIYLINFALVIRICHKTAKVNYAYVLLECFDCKEAILLSDIIISQLYNP